MTGTGVFSHRFPLTQGASCTPRLGVLECVLVPGLGHGQQAWKGRGWHQEVSKGITQGSELGGKPEARMDEQANGQ